MKRGIITVVAVLLFGVGFVASMQPWERARAQDDRFIEITTTRKLSPSVYSAEDDGDDCGYPPDIFRFFTTDAQLVIRNEADEIVAIQTLTGTVETDEPEFTYCRGSFSVAVPEASFYTVYLGEERIQGYAADEFPLDGFPIMISFE